MKRNLVFLPLAIICCGSLTTTTSNGLFAQDSQVVQPAQATSQPPSTMLVLTMSSSNPAPQSANSFAKGSSVRLSNGRGKNLSHESAQVVQQRKSNNKRQNLTENSKRVRAGANGSESLADTTRKRTSQTQSLDSQAAQRKKNLALGSSAYRTQRYGERGETIGEFEMHSNEFGSVDSTSNSQFGETTVYGKTRTGEVRSRSYKDSLDLGAGDSSAAIGVEAQASAVRAEYGVTNKVPTLNVGGIAVENRQQASVDAFVGGQAHAGASIDLDSNPQVSVGGGVFVGAKVQANASNTTSVLGASSTQSGRAHASAGAEADAGASLGLDGVDAEAGAFAGARAGASGSVEVAGVEGGGTAEAWAGVGARGKADAGYNDGKLNLEIGAGAAIGVGGSVNTNITIDVAKSVHDERAVNRQTSRVVNRGVKNIGSSFNKGSRQLGSSIVKTQSRKNRFGRSGFSAPVYKTPKVNLSKIRKPKISKPRISKPKISKPRIKIPKIKKPKIKSPFGR